MQMILLGKPISADEARSAGLIADVYDNGSVLHNVLETAKSLAALSPTALFFAKEAICKCKYPAQHPVLLSPCLIFRR